MSNSGPEATYSYIHIPSDIVAAVLDALPLGREERAALALCRLVSHEWDSLACPLLFRTLRVTFVLPDYRYPSKNLKRTSSLLSFLDSKPTLASYIRSLTIVNNCWTTQHRLTDTALSCANPITMDNLFEMLSVLPNLKDLYLSQVCPPEDLRVDPPWSARKFNLRGLSVNAPLTMAGFRRTCVSEVLRLFESVHDLSLNAIVTDGLADPWALAAPPSSSASPSLPRSGPEVPNLARIFRVGSLHLDPPFCDPELLVSIRGVHHLDLSYSDTTFYEVQQLNRLLLYLPALQSLEIGELCDNGPPLDGAHCKSSCRPPRA